MRKQPGLDLDDEVYVSGVRSLGVRDLHLSPKGIKGSDIADGAVLANLPQAVQGYTHDITFVAASQTQVNWGSGTIKFYDGTTQAILAGSVVMTTEPVYYIYFDLSQTQPQYLQFTTNYLNIVDNKKGVLCLCQKGSTASILPTIIPNQGKMPYLTSDVFQQSSISYDQIADGAFFKRLIYTDVTAGHIKLTSYTQSEGEWYDHAGVDINASTGITIYGSNTAFRTRATKNGPDQCYVGSDGKIYAGAGTVILDANGLTINGQKLFFQNGVGVTAGYVHAIGNVLTMNGIYGAIQLYAGPGTVEISGQVVPYSSASFSTDKLGTAARKWPEVHCTTLYQGDSVFANGWRLTECKDKEGMQLLRPDGSIAQEWT